MHFTCTNIFLIVHFLNSPCIIQSVQETTRTLHEGVLSEDGDHLQSSSCTVCSPLLTLLLPWMSQLRLSADQSSVCLHRPSHLTTRVIQRKKFRRNFFWKYYRRELLWKYFRRELSWKYFKKHHHHHSASQPSYNTHTSQCFSNSFEYFVSITFAAHTSILPPHCENHPLRIKFPSWSCYPSHVARYQLAKSNFLNFSSPLITLEIAKQNRK